MPVVVTLPNALLNLFPGSQKRVEVTAATVGEMVDALDARWPGMRDRLCDSTPRLRRHNRPQRRPIFRRRRRPSQGDGRI